jgi:toxin ParE1/3/4
VSAWLLAPAAKDDLAEIWDYTSEQWGDEQADRYVRDITDACQALADERRHGRPINEIRHGYFKLAVGSHFLCYRITTEGATEIVRILHQRMDIMTRLQ